MTKPTLHDNGTPPALLAKTYEHAHDALQSALAAMKGTGPNARDWQGPDDFDRAWNEHRDRMARVAAVMAEYDTLIGHCEGRGE